MVYLMVFADFITALVMADYFQNQIDYLTYFILNLNRSFITFIIITDAIAVAVIHIVPVAVAVIHIVAWPYRIMHATSYSAALAIATDLRIRCHITSLEFIAAAAAVPIASNTVGIVAVAGIADLDQQNCLA